MRIRLIDKLEGIIRESVKPLERIESIKILHVDGLGGGGSAAPAAWRRGGFADSVVDSALRFRAQAPLVDQLLREIGVDGGDVGKIARGMLERSAERGPSASARAAAATIYPNRMRMTPMATRPHLKRSAPSAGSAGAIDTWGEVSEGGRSPPPSSMIKVYTSSVIDAPADAVWAVIRDFNGLPRWTPFVAESRIEAGLPADKVGCVRNFRLKDGGVIREQLLALSDYDYQCTYSILDSPMGVEGYVATLKLTPVTDGNRTFAEWSAEFECAPEREKELAERIGQGVFQAALTNLKGLVRGRQ